MLSGAVRLCPAVAASGLMLSGSTCPGMDSAGCCRASGCVCPGFFRRRRLHLSGLLSSCPALCVGASRGASRRGDYRVSGAAWLISSRLRWTPGAVSDAGRRVQLSGCVCCPGAVSMAAGVRGRASGDDVAEDNDGKEEEKEQINHCGGSFRFSLMLFFGLLWASVAFSGCRVGISSSGVLPGLLGAFLGHFRRRRLLTLRRLYWCGCFSGGMDSGGGI